MYDLNNDGQIMNHGKFEGEQAWVPGFWEQVLNGFESETIYENDRPVAIVLVTDEDRQEYAELAIDSVYAIALVESEQGFVTAIKFSEAGLDRYRSRVEYENQNKDGE